MSTGFFALLPLGAVMFVMWLIHVKNMRISALIVGVPILYASYQAGAYAWMRAGVQHPYEVAMLTVFLTWLLLQLYYAKR